MFNFTPTVIRHRSHDDGFAVVVTDGHGRARFQVYDTAFGDGRSTYLIVDTLYATEDSAIDAFIAPPPAAGYGS